MAPNLAHHYRSPYLHPLPHYRTYFPGLAQSCNPFIRSLTLSPRRTAFLLILLARTLQTSYYILLSGAAQLAHNKSIWILVAICIVAFTVELWNLHLIVESEGEGRACGRVVPAGAFSLFLFWTVVWHAWFVPLEVTGLAFYGGAGPALTMEGVWIGVIAFVGWIANREYEVEGMLLV